MKRRKICTGGSNETEWIYAARQTASLHLHFPCWDRWSVLLDVASESLHEWWEPAIYMCVCLCVCVHARFVSLWHVQRLMMGDKSASSTEEEFKRPSAWFPVFESETHTDVLWRCAVVVPLLCRVFWHRSSVTPCWMMVILTMTDCSLSLLCQRWTAAESCNKKPCPALLQELELVFLSGFNVTHKRFLASFIQHTTHTFDTSTDF